MLGIHFVSHLLYNLHIAMLMEAIGVGPQHYCICFDHSPNTYRKPKLLLYSLPQEKMFIYLANARLEGPFLHEPWLSRARAILSCPSLTRDEYVASFVHFWVTIPGLVHLYIWSLLMCMILYNGYTILLLRNKVWILEKSWILYFGCVICQPSKVN